jgi:polysaccharide deacetylase 2 family uncharacterized protein YibQ
MNRRQFFIKTATSLLPGLIVAGPWHSLALAAGIKEKSRAKAEIAIIIDDIGFSRARAYKFLDLGISLTFSVLPRITFTKELADTLHFAGYEIMLHQPMEPVDDSYNPGPGALYTAFRNKEIVAAIDQNILEIPHVTGVNNHMGSKFTADRDKMGRALKVVKHRKLFFVDSMTTHRSAGYKTARRLGISTARRNIFLDNRIEVPAVLNQLEKLQAIALKTGKALAIGHPFPETAAAIDIFNRKMKKPGVKFVPVSSVLNS